MGAFRCMGIFAAALVIVGCASPLDLAGYPLYPDVGRRLAGNEVARLYGPITRVDDRDVSTLGDALELMPGCHRVRTRDDPVPNTFGRSTAGGGFRFGARSFVFSMKGGHAYVLKRLGSAAGVGVYIEEHDASGAWSGDIYPGDSAACQFVSGRF
ncbi:MAG: hypothetical protein WBY94_15060 [Polyangiaceae bacterium]